MPKNNFPAQSPNTLAESGLNERDLFSYKTNGIDGGFDKRTCDITAHDILNDILTSLGGSSGTPFRLFNRILSTPGTMQVLLAQTVPSGETLTPKLIKVSGRKAGTYDIKIDGNTIGSGRIGAGKLVDNFIFHIDITLTQTQTLSVEFTALTGNPASDVDVHLQALKTP